MRSPGQNFVLFKTDLFLFEQSDEDINHWFFGGDCAGWFYARLLPIAPIKHSCEPVMEDWGGWTFAVSVHDIQVWVNVWPYYEIKNCWIFGVEVKKRFFGGHSAQAMADAKESVCKALESIITADPRFAKHDWFVQNPFELQIKRF
jgi:hypothetical protein